MRLNTRRYVTILGYMLPISMLTSFTKSVLKLFQVIPYKKKNLLSLLCQEQVSFYAIPAYDVSYAKNLHPQEVIRNTCDVYMWYLLHFNDSLHN